MKVHILNLGFPDPFFSWPSECSQIHFTLSEETRVFFEALIACHHISCIHAQRISSSPFRALIINFNTFQFEKSTNRQVREQNIRQEKVQRIFNKTNKKKSGTKISSNLLIYLDKRRYYEP